MKAPFLGSLLFALLLPSSLFAAASLDTITLEEVPGSDVKRGVVVGVVEAPLKEVWNVITDYEHYADFMPRTEKAEVRERTSSRVRFFSYLNMPWPIKDVSYDCEVKLSPDHETVSFEMVPGTGKGVKAFQGSWTLKPLKESNKSTIVTYSLFFVSEQGFAPWLANLGTKKSLSKVIQAIRERITILKPSI